MPYEVLTRVGNSWENVWKERFPTFIAAEMALNTFFSNVDYAYRHGQIADPYSRNDYQIVKVAAQSPSS